MNNIIKNDKFQPVYESKSLSKRVFEKILNFLLSIKRSNKLVEDISNQFYAECESQRIFYLNPDDVTQFNFSHDNDVFEVTVYRTSQGNTLEIEISLLGSTKSEKSMFPRSTFLELIENKKPNNSQLFPNNRMLSATKKPRAVIGCTHKNIKNNIATNMKREATKQYEEANEKRNERKKVL